MARTQLAVVAGVGRCLEAHGVRRTTMIDIAAAAGIAKGTLYNHVRTKGEAIALYVEDEIAGLVGSLTGERAAALVSAAELIAVHPGLRRLVVHEPAVLADLLVGPAVAQATAPVREALDDLLGPSVAPLALRWLTSLLADPGTAEERTAIGAILAGAAG